jgi:hypothetical protein
MTNWRMGLPIVCNAESLSKFTVLIFAEKKHSDPLTSTVLGVTTGSKGQDHSAKHEYSMT